MKKKDHLYIFLHLPKTGGSTFSVHLKKYLKKDQFVDMTLLRYGLHKNIANGAISDKTKVILGHASYYGIHKLFPNKIPRYIIFLRDPAERIVSEYNFEMRVKQGKSIPFWNWYASQPRNELTYFMDLKARGKEGTKANLPRIFLKPIYKFFKYKKITLIFQNLFEKYYALFLSSRKKMKTKLTSSNKLLKECWFIGIIPGLNKDLEYLFKEIGVPTKWKNSNVTEKSKILFKLDEVSRAKLYRENRYDKELFDYAVKLKNKRK